MWTFLESDLYVNSDKKKQLHKFSMLKIIKEEHTAIFLVMILMEDAKTETWSENDPNMILLEIFLLNFLCD